VDGDLVEMCYLDLECAWRGVIDGFGENRLIIGDVVRAAAHEDALRDAERDEGDQMDPFPRLACLSPGRLAEIRQSMAFPFSEGSSR